MSNAADAGLAFVWKAFDALTVGELHDLLKLRCDVFVVEQNCAYHEIDGADRSAFHLLALAQDGSLAGYLRVLPPETADAAVRIGRVVVAADRRGSGLGRALMQQALEEIPRRFGARPVVVAAQAHLEALYGSLGFVPTSEEYLDEGGVVHIDMRRAATATV